MPASGSPKMRIVPEEGRSNPAATLRSVDLPQPVGPTTETNSPSPIESVTSFTAVYARPPLRAAKVQVMFSKETASGIEDRGSGFAPVCHGPRVERRPWKDVRSNTENYLYFEFAFSANRLSNVFERSIFPAFITEGSNWSSTL